MTRRSLALLLAFVLASGVLVSADSQGYRDYRFATSLTAIATQADVAPVSATVLHRRPALIQELLWRPPYFVPGSSTRQTDPVAQIVFGFFNDQLFRIVIDYDTDRTAGLNDADLIQVISETYGVVAKPASPNARRVPRGDGEESDTLVARWGTSELSVDLLRVAYPVSYRLIVHSTPLRGLAATAITEAERLDRREAPQRALALEKQAGEDSRAAQEKTRLANKAAFKP